MTVATDLLDFVFPPACLACGDVVDAPGFFCLECEPLLLPTGPVHCVRCGEPGAFVGDVCPRCRRRPPAFARAFAPFEHDGAVARATHRFKYENQPELSCPLGALMWRESRAFLEEAPKRVCPIPLHARRYRSRGYDQATLLAVELCTHSKDLVLCDDWLSRCRATQRQVGLSDEARLANVEGAFTASTKAAGTDVLLIDDVVTTGATAHAAARALLAAGVRRVEVLALGRARRLDAF